MAQQDSQYFYDSQIRRFLLQFARIMSHYQVYYGTDPSGEPVYQRVPIRYGNSSRNVAAILRQNSENSLPSTPLMTFYIAGMEYDRPRVQEPNFVDKLNIRERTYNQTSNQFEQTQGNAFTIERLMPAPHLMKINLDVWSSSEEQKQEIFEQITWLFNPSYEIQSTDNYVDWTSLSVIERTGMQWSSRSIPVGTDDAIDILTINFEIPIWISAPVKVKKLGVITKIIASLYNDAGNFVDAVSSSDLLMGTRQQFTPTGYRVLLLNNQLQLIKVTDVVTGDNHDLNIPYTISPTEELWHPVIDLYGGLRNGVSLIRLWNEDSQSEIVGTISFNPTDDRFLLFNIDIDTIPANTLQPITKVINPIRTGPGTKLEPSGYFPLAATGQRYLLLDDIGSNLDAEKAEAWKGTDGSELRAKANDVIEYDGVKWFVAFNSDLATTLEYLTNITSGIQYKWTGKQWIKSFEGLYEAGTWSVVI